MSAPNSEAAPPPNLKPWPRASPPLNWATFRTSLAAIRTKNAATLARLKRTTKTKTVVEKKRVNLDWQTTHSPTFGVGSDWVRACPSVDSPPAKHRRIACV